MANLNKKQIQARALTLLETSPGGVRWGEMMKIIHGGDPETNTNSIHGALQNLLTDRDAIAKVARGTYQLRKYQEAQDSAAIAQETATANEPIIVETLSHARVTLVEADF